MLFLKGKASHITSLLKTFQWFPIMLCIKAKLLINARKAARSCLGGLTLLLSLPRRLIPVILCLAPCHSGLILRENTSYPQSQVATQSLPHLPLLILSTVLCPRHFSVSCTPLRLLSSATLNNTSFTFKCGQQILWSIYL